MPMPIEEGYYLAIYRQRAKKPSAQPVRVRPIGPELVRVFRSYGEGETAVLLALRFGYARSYRLDYFEFQTRIDIPL